MEKWKGKLAVVTGASSGIGAAVARDLVKEGMIVAGLARRREKIDELRDELPTEKRKDLHSVYCDVCSQESVDTAFDYIEKNYGTIHVLVNSAGILKHGDTVKNSLADLELVMQTNFMGAVRCTMRAYNSMTKVEVNGHIVNINSSLGYHIPVVPALNMYPSSKHALNAFTQVMRNEMGYAKTKIKTTSINPGMVHTDLPGEMGEKLYSMFPYMYVDDVANAVTYALSTPAHINITDLNLKPMAEICELQELIQNQSANNPKT